MALELSLSVCEYDRTAAIFDGRAPVEGCDVTAVSLVPEESFHRAFKYQEFDVTEISMSSYLLSVARNDSHYVAIPAFLIKFGFMGLAALNMIVFHFTTEKTMLRWDKGRPALGARLAGGVSLVLWTAIVICGREVGFSL